MDNYCPRDCLPEDETRNCDCNYQKGICHCSDCDGEWEPNPIFCQCETSLIPEV